MSHFNSLIVNIVRHITSNLLLSGSAQEQDWKTVEATSGGRGSDGAVTVRTSG